MTFVNYVNRGGVGGRWEIQNIYSSVKGEGFSFSNFLKLKTFEILAVVTYKNNSTLFLWIWTSLAVMKDKITSSLKSSLTKRPFALWVPETKQTDLLLRISLMKFLGKKVWISFDKRAKSKLGEGCQIDEKIYAKGGCSKWVNRKHFGFEKTLFHKRGSGQVKSE